MTGRRSTGGIDDQVVGRVLALAEESRSQDSHRGPTVPPLRLMVVDAQPVVLLGLRALFDVARHCHVIAEATSAEQAVEMALLQQPDVVVMDADLPAASGFVAARRIIAADPEIRVIMFGSGADPHLVVAAIHSGVRGYLLKRASPARVVQAVEVVGEGGADFDDAVVDAVQQWLRSGRPGGEPLERLSRQERNIVQLIAQGRTNREIAATLHLSEFTVKTYVSTALRKLDLTSRAEAAALFVRRQHDE